MSHAHFEIALVLLLSTCGFLVAQFTGIPSILFLLILGILSGPGLGILHPDLLLGDLFVPLVSIAVGIILFEGGLTLQARDFRSVGRAVVMLVTVGLLVTFAMSSALAYCLLGTPMSISLLIGAITVVSGPTVVQPLLRQVRPSKPLGTILRWEGILIDPVGVLLTVIVFDALTLHSGESTAALVVGHVLGNILTGSLLGALSGVFLTWLLSRHFLADHLHIPLTLTVIVGTQVLADSFFHESGLVAVTLLGFYMINRCKVHVAPLLEFTEILRDLLIGMLFILLGARLSVAAFDFFDMKAFLFLFLLIFLVRPAAVFVSTFFEKLDFRQKLFLSFIAPRGIVAASVASLFSLRLQQEGFEMSEAVLPFTFFVIIGTVTFYSFFSAPLAKLLNLRKGDPQGVLFLGAHDFARDLATAVQTMGFRVILIDTNPLNVAAARSAGLESHHGNILSEDLVTNLDLDGIGKLFALSSNDEANSLAAVHFAPLFHKNNVFQLAPIILSDFSASERLLVQPYGRILFSSDTKLHDLLSGETENWHIKVLVSDSTIQGSQNSKDIELVALGDDGNLIVATDEVGLPQSKSVNRVVLRPN